MPTDSRTILQLRVPLVVQIAKRTVPLQMILSLGPGAILELEKSADDELDLLINNKPVGRGEAVKVGENFGIRISEMDSVDQRVEALGQGG